MQSIEKRVRNRIYGHGRGWCFTPNSFADLGNAQAIRTSLFRLEKGGTIRRLSRGLYDYPRNHPAVGFLAPHPEAVAKALAARDTTRLQASGAYAANSLGLTDQVPARVVFLTDGPDRRVRIGKQEIILKRTTPRNMVSAGKASGMVIQALRHLGNIKDSRHHIAHLSKILNTREKDILIRDKPYAPRWMHPVIDAIVESDND